MPKTHFFPSSVDSLIPFVHLLHLVSGNSNISKYLAGTCQNSTASLATNLSKDDLPQVSLFRTYLIHDTEKYNPGEEPPEESRDETFHQCGSRYKQNFKQDRFSHAQRSFADLMGTKKTQHLLGFFKLLDGFIFAIEQRAHGLAREHFNRGFVKYFNRFARYVYRTPRT